MKIGIIREGKIPQDRRVALTPQACQQLLSQNTDLKIILQPSSIRCFPDSAYQEVGVTITENLTDCDILLGIKEVPIQDLIPNKTYFFFSHTIKKQPYNQKLLQTLLAKKIRMIDWETLTNRAGERLIAFGRFAGIVGAYNAIRGYGLRHKLYELKPAYQCNDLAHVWKQLETVKLPPLKIVITGDGRVGTGAKETMLKLSINQVSPADFLNKTYCFPVFTQLAMSDYHQHKVTRAFEQKDFYQNPQNYDSTFLPFAQTADMLIACAYWDNRAPVLFTKKDMMQPSFKIKMIADVTCDIDGSIPSTQKPSTIENPFYDYNPQTQAIQEAFTSDSNILVMAVDNLPNELPVDASAMFAQTFIDLIFPYLQDDKDSVLERATICQNGSLTPKFAYLQDFADGKL